jgi:hypothetical protein
VAGRRQRPWRGPLFCGRAAEGTVSTVGPASTQAGPTVRSRGPGRARLGCASAGRRASPPVERRTRLSARTAYRRPRRGDPAPDLTKDQASNGGCTPIRTAGTAAIRRAWDRRFEDLRPGGFRSMKHRAE